MNGMKSLRRALFGCLLIGAVGASGCVERLLQVRSDPPGATVWVNGQEVGTTPLDHPFTHYGTYEVTLRGKGHYSHRELKPVRPPWYEYFPLDFFSELLIPWTLEDVHTVDAKLVPIPRSVTQEKIDELEGKAEKLGRHEGPTAGAE